MLRPIQTVDPGMKETSQRNVHRKGPILTGKQGLPMGSAQGNTVEENAGEIEEEYLRNNNPEFENNIEERTLPFEIQSPRDAAASSAFHPW